MAVARRLLWHLFSVGRAWRNKPEVHPIPDKSGVFLFFVVAGSGVLLQSGQRWELSTGPRCWLVDTRQPRTYEPLSGQRLETIGVRFSDQGWMLGWRRWRRSANFTLPVQTDFHFLETAQQRLMQLVMRRPATNGKCMRRLLNCSVALLAMRQVLATKPMRFEGSFQSYGRSAFRSCTSLACGPNWRGVAKSSYSGLRSLFRAIQHESLHEFWAHAWTKRNSCWLTNGYLSKKLLVG